MADETSATKPTRGALNPAKARESMPSEPSLHESTGRRTSGARPGGRSERVVRDILEATAIEIGRSGYANLGIDEIAARAGVAKTTIYRRWPTKAELVTAALRAIHLAGAAADSGEDTSAEEPRDVDTGSVRTDLLELLRGWAAMAGTPIGMSIIRMVNLELGNPEVEAIARELRSEKRAPLLTAIRRGIARGELSPDIDPALMTEVLAVAVGNRCKLREPVDDAFLEKLVDLIVAGAASGRSVGRAEARKPTARERRRRRTGRRPRTRPQ
jgi:AcrR family transcriptional regulator